MTNDLWQPWILQVWRVYEYNVIQRLISQNVHPIIGY